MSPSSSPRVYNERAREERRCLPQELVDEVIDLLHDERNALRACSLVSRRWLPRAQLHLFHELVVDGAQRSYQSLYSAIRSLGLPCLYVRHLRLATCKNINWQRRPPVDVDVLATILPHFPNLHTLSLSGNRFGGNCGYQACDAPRYKLDELSMFCVGSMSYSDVTFLEILALFSEIKQLHLMHLGFGYYFPTTFAISLPASRVQIHSLILERVEEIAKMLHLLRPLIDPHVLKRLSVTCSNVFELRSLGAFLQVNGGAICHFELDIRCLSALNVSADYWLEFGFLCLSSLQSFRTFITLGTKIPSSNSAVIDHLASLLSALPDCEAIELVICPPPDADDGTLTINAEWLKLNSVWSKYQCLKRVSFYKNAAKFEEPRRIVELSTESKVPIIAGTGHLLERGILCFDLQEGS